MSEQAAKILETLLRQPNCQTSRCFSELEIKQLLLFYKLVLKWNARLHLTTIVNPEQFFFHHIMEPVIAESLLSTKIDKIYDLGTGLGVPGIPLAIMKPNISVILIEAQRAKTIFLEEVVSALSLTNVIVLNKRIESLEPFPEGSGIVARAVEQFEKLMSPLITKGNKCEQMIFFGARSLENVIRINLPDAFHFDPHSIPWAEKRFIYNVFRST